MKLLNCHFSFCKRCYVNFYIFFAITRRINKISFLTIDNWVGYGRIMHNRYKKWYRLRFNCITVLFCISFRFSVHWKESMFVCNLLFAVDTRKEWIECLFVSWYKTDGRAAMVKQKGITFFCYILKEYNYTVYLLIPL